MAEYPTTGELYKAKAILEADVAAAVDAFIADPTTTAFLFGDGYSVDIAEAVSSHDWAKVTVANKEATDHLKWVAVRTAILLARPERHRR
ncbi:hypothetical protein ASF41_22355 [Methylobacterium sp. Leaf111]|uniref:hypothetical protein n=1 Tax=Methylobacterium sp. Leaf111 TaxID=1736257 RepID=UPI0006F81D92|nr:hypothetical protein [Methylobacterium sp. Leaf111]KQP63283.1 hypothetical protein ASF41_22355 [Methylobacterium sp. Leaf111]